MRFTGGWVKLHRQFWDGDIPNNHTCTILWFWLISHANYKQSKIIFQGKQKILEPGQLVCGYRELSARLGISKSNVHRWFKYLADTGRINIESGTQGSVVTICNWDDYQADGKENGTQAGQEKDTKRTPRGHDADTARTRRGHGENLNEESKNKIREEKKESEIESERDEVAFDGEQSSPEDAEERKAGNENEEPRLTHSDEENEMRDWSTDPEAVMARLKKKDVSKEKKPKSKFSELQREKLKGRQEKSNRLEDEAMESFRLFHSLATRIGLRPGNDPQRNDLMKAMKLIKEHGKKVFMEFIESATNHWDEYKKISKIISDQPNFNDLTYPYGCQKWDSGKNKIWENGEWQGKTQHNGVTPISSRVKSIKQLKTESEEG